MKYAIVVRGNSLNNYAAIGVSGPFDSYESAYEFNQRFTFSENNEITEFRYPIWPKES